MEIFYDGGAEARRQTAVQDGLDWLEEKGYPLQYLETADGHSGGNWRGMMENMLRFFFEKK